MRPCLKAAPQTRDETEEFREIASEERETGLDEPEMRGLIRMENGWHLGFDGYGKAAHWIFCEMPANDGNPPDHSFREWAEEKNLRTNILPMRHKDRAPG